jgi:hypothetical protein
MRMGELFNGLRCMITNEQRGFFETLKELQSVTNEDLDERGQRLAEELTSLGLINRQYNEENKEIRYSLFQR